jgi:hypothetical protein
MADAGISDVVARTFAGSSDSSEEGQGAWWESGRFTAGRRNVRTIRNGIYEEHCRIFDKVIAARQNSLDAPALSALRGDVMAATRWSAKRDAITECLRRLNEWTLSYAIAVPASLALILISPTPDWTKALVILACLLFLVPSDADTSGVRDAFTILALPLVAIVVLVTPLDGWRILWRLLAVLFVLIASSGITRLNLTVIVRFFSYRALFLLALLDGSIVVISTAGFDRLFGRFDWPVLVAFAVRFGLAGGALLGLLLVTIEVVNQAGYRLVDAYKLRRIPEAEFVQSTIWALSDLDTKMPLEWADLPEQRRVINWRLGWLVRVLEIDIPRELAKVDPSNAAHIQASFRRKAAVLHRWKQNLLLGDKDTGETIIDDIWGIGVIGANRRWSLLPEMEVNTPSKERLIRRAWGMAKRLLALLVPATILVASLIANQKGAALTAAIITAFVLVDILSPGSGSKVADAAGQADKVLPSLPDGMRRKG